MQPAQRNALLALLEPVYRRGGKSEFPRELGEGLLPSPAAKKISKLLVQRTCHGIFLRHCSFRMWNIFRIWNGSCTPYSSKYEAARHRR